ncbi:MAG: hypothetical protein MR663_01030, partial [Lachnospiraceae bacterium]|nr:hypothetical protein [Lachnospiraceae bacterium]
ARKFEQTIKDQDSDAYNKLSEQWETNVWENEKILKYRLGVIKEMIDSYISDMTDYIAPENETAMMRVDRNDIWWNYKQIEGEATSFDWIVQDTGSTLATYKRLFIPNPFSSDEENEAKKSAQQQEEDAESARRQRNYEKLQGFRDQLDTSIRKKLSDSVDEIKKIYENKVIPFENTDDSYKSKMSAYYSEWSSMGDKFSDAGNAIRDFLAGIGDSLVDTVKGLLTLVVDLGILYVDVRWKSIVPIQVPEVLDQEVEKIKQKYEPLLKDPVNTIGGIGQSICDTADEKGVAYSSGYIVTEVVTALLADKGLDKIKNVAKTGKTADNVADIAEGAAKGAGNAAEDAGKAGKGLEGAAKGAGNAAEDAGKAGKGLEEAAKGAESAAEDAGKVVESGSNFKGQLYNGTRNPDVDFVNGKGKSTLNKHAGKHGYTSPEEYLKDARNFLEKKPTSTIQSFVSNEGTYFRYDTATNEFGIINEYGGISTYFKPENGMAYWLEQIEKYAPK